MFRKHPARFDEDDWRVLQDRLVARGDPRGELIGLTLDSRADASLGPRLLALRAQLEEPARATVHGAPIELLPRWSPLGWNQLRVRVLAGRRAPVELAPLWRALRGSLAAWMVELRFAALTADPTAVRPEHTRLRRITLAFQPTGQGALDLGGLPDLRHAVVEGGPFGGLRLPGELRTLSCSGLASTELLAEALGTTPALDHLQVDFGSHEPLDGPSLFGLLGGPSLPALKQLVLATGTSALIDGVPTALLDRAEPVDRLELRSRTGGFSREGLPGLHELLYRWPRTTVILEGHELPERDVQHLEHLGCQVS